MGSKDYFPGVTHLEEKLWQGAIFLGIKFPERPTGILNQTSGCDQYLCAYINRLSRLTPLIILNYKELVLQKVTFATFVKPVTSVTKVVLLL